MKSAFRSARVAVPAIALAVVVWRLGAGPFLDGVRAVDGGALLAATGIGLLTTVCCAWRWTIVARGLGVRLSLSAAVAAYYRSIFLNLTLPGGVAGDVLRGVSHGRDVHDVGLALRIVAWERAAGQVVQALLTIAVLLVVPSPVRSSMPLVAVVLAVTAAGAVLAVRVRPGGGRSRWKRLRSAVAADLRAGLLRRETPALIALTSTVVVLGHAVTFLVAARTVGVAAPISRLLPLALLALLAMALPSVAGWGPREGGTAWVFASAGLGADRGAATAVAYGVMAIVAGLPGVLVLVAGWLHRRRLTPLPARIPVVVVRTEEVADA